MRQIFIFWASLLICCVYSTVSADIGPKDLFEITSNYAPPLRAKIIMKTKALPHDQQADHERMESEQLDQLATALQAVTEKETRLSEMQQVAERKIEEANRKAQEALELAELPLNQAQSESNAYGGSGYPYERSYNPSIYNRWYYRYSSKIINKKRDFKYRPKQYYKNKYRHIKRQTYKYRDGGYRHYNPRKSHLGRKSTTTPGGFGHRRSIGTRSFSFNR